MAGSIWAPDLEWGWGWGGKQHFSVRALWEPSPKQVRQPLLQCQTRRAINIGDGGSQAPGTAQGESHPGLAFHCGRNGGITRSSLGFSAGHPQGELPNHGSTRCPAPHQQKTGAGLSELWWLALRVSPQREAGHPSLPHRGVAHRASGEQGKSRCPLARVGLILQFQPRVPSVEPHCRLYAFHRKCED